MSNVELLRRFVSIAESIVKPFQTFVWEGDTEKQALEMLKRASIVRQWECLKTQLILADANVGYTSVTFVRPAYEELVWFTYLKSVPQDKHEIALLLGIQGIGKSLKGQLRYLGAETMVRIGWNPVKLMRHLMAGSESDAKLKDIGKRLGWPRGKPTFFYLAKLVDREKEYSFLYHATSSFVHFSPHELFRRIWGSHGTVDIGSSKFSAYWQEFAAYWSLRIFIELLTELSDLFPDEENDEAGSTEILEIASKLIPVPIVTPEELVSWPTPEKDRKMGS